MTKMDSLMNEIRMFPDDMLDEVIGFAQYLKGKRMRQGIELAVLSESSLAKDWLTEEENTAWQNL